MGGAIFFILLCLVVVGYAKSKQGKTKNNSGSGGRSAPSNPVSQKKKEKEDCFTCSGTGFAYGKQCQSCGGNGIRPFS